MWTEHNNALTATLRFRDFAEAFTFMTEVAALAEQHQHHPDWRNVWNTVEIRLSTHDAGNVVTEKDHRLAAAIEVVAARFDLMG
jgi:4a-hydroxytetrahydrobiopterin dehydratase